MVIIPEYLSHVAPILAFSPSHHYFLTQVVVPPSLLLIQFSSTFAQLFQLSSGPRYDLCRAVGAIFALHESGQQHRPSYWFVLCHALGLFISDLLKKIKSPPSTGCFFMGIITGALQVTRSDLTPFLNFKFFHAVFLSNQRSIQIHCTSPHTFTPDLHLLHSCSLPFLASVFSGRGPGALYLSPW